jgi:NADPH:quinone reductase-like Zn-dependent oxidoreductase
MRAVVIGEKFGAENLCVIERPVPKPGRCEVLVRVRAAALNYRDLRIISGTYHQNFKPPLVPLSDGVGVVTSVGEDVSRVAVGDRVCGVFFQRWVGGALDPVERFYQLGGPLNGMLADYVLLDERGVVKAPDHLTDLEAATLPCAGVTAWHALFTEGALIAGDTVLVLGTGGVSLFGLQFAVSAGARAIVISSSDEKLERAVALGAKGTINYKTHPNWFERVLEETDGRGVDHVLEVGGPSTFGQSLRSIRPGGKISMIGYLGGTEGSINPIEIFRRQARVHSTPVGSRASHEAMTRSMVTNDIKPVLDQTFSWFDVAAAISYMNRGQHFGKITLAF